MSHKRKTKKGGASDPQPLPPKDREDWPGSDPDSSQSRSGSGPADPDDMHFRPSFLGGGEELPDHLGPIKQLYCKTGFNLAVSVDGRVYGTREAFDPLAVLELSSDTAGEVRIKGVEAGLYIAMDELGRLYAKGDDESDDSVFFEDMVNGYNRYLSKPHADEGWYLAIKKSGKPKKGPLTASKQNAVQFLPRPAKPS